MNKSIINWQLVCLNLQNQYKSLEVISREVGTGGDHLRRLARNDVIEPKFSVGLRLLDLHLEHCPGKHHGVLVNG